MLEQLRQLESLSRLLEPDAEQRADTREKAVQYGEDFLNCIDDTRAFVFTEGNGSGLLESPLGEEAISPEAALRLLHDHVDTPGLNPASGGHLGYIPGGGIYYSAVADYLADITNRYAGIFFASPGAVRMENMLIRWMAELVGYPAGASGNLASGGSIANLTAIVTAREAHHIKARDIENTVIYLSAQAHHCIDKAIRIAGMQECVQRTVPLDQHYRMIPEALEEMILEDKAAGLKPFMVIASAGTTDAGAVDPLEELGIIAKNYRLWYHVDAAYGGFFLLTDHGKKIMKGIELSDSVVMDPHKGLFLPYGLGVVLVKDVQALKTAHHYQANYMQDAGQSTDELSPADLSPELTKHFRGLRLWLPLKLHGLKPFRAALDEKLLLARYFYEEIQKIPGFVAGPYPELSVVTYRYIPEYGDADDYNKRIVDAVQHDGRVFISSTLLDGHFTLRLAVLSFRTHLSTINTLLEVIKNTVMEFELHKAV
jgi:aromatic-L-amino-acid/L-tryptophan decarboxylase